MPGITSVHCINLRRDKSGDILLKSKRWLTDSYYTDEQATSPFPFPPHGSQVLMKKMIRREGEGCEGAERNNASDGGIVEGGCPNCYLNC